MKQVLIVFPGLRLDIDEGAKHRLNCYINEYNAKGDNVTVLAFCKSGILNRDRKRYMNPNAKWILLPYLLPKSMNRVFSWFLDMYLTFILQIVTWLKKYDIVQMEIENINHTLCGKSLYITDVHGDSLHEASEIKNLNSNHWFVKYLRHIQNNIVQKSDYLITVSENLKLQVEENTNLKVDNYSIISCGVDYDKFAKATKQTIPINTENKIIIGYSGGLQAWQNFDKMIDIVIELRKTIPELFFIIFTNSSVDPFKKKLSKLGEENYLVKSLLSSEVPEYLKLFDAGFLLRDDKILNKVASPTKICEYLAAGVPIICTKFSGDFERSIIHGQNGFVATNPTLTQEEIQSLSKWLLEVKKNRDSVARNCQEAAQKRTFSEEFNEFYKKISSLSREEKL